MYMVRHYHVFFYDNVIVEIIKLLDVFLCDLAVFGQYYRRTVEDAGPYNT